MPNLLLHTTAPLALALSLASSLPAQEFHPVRHRTLTLGSGFILTRNQNSKLWGLNATIENRAGSVGVYRGRVSFDFLGGPDVRIANLGFDVGIKPQSEDVTTLATVGIGLFYFGAQRDLTPGCRDGFTCFRGHAGYEPGLMVAGSGSLGIGLRLSEELRSLAELQIYVPANLGSAGYAPDLRAAFVRLLIGVSMAR